MSRIEEATELSSAALDGEYQKIEALCVSSAAFGEQGVSIPALLAVIYHKTTKMKDVSSPPSGCLSQEECTEVSSDESSGTKMSCVYILLCY